MTASEFWQQIGAGDTFLTKLIRFLFLLVAAVTMYFLAALPLNWPQQAVCGILTVLMALALARSSDSYLITLTLMIMSLFCTVRYGYWRIATTWGYFKDPSIHSGLLDAFFILSLVAAELYAFVILFLGYFQTVWPLRRAPVALPDDDSLWPHVDILVPTYNEPLDVVRYTVLGALNIDWPVNKLHVYILDDGRRKEFEQFAREAGVGYRTRNNNQHAKAGNINAALKTIDSPFVAIFDCDHVPTRSFLQLTMGWFLRDKKLGMLQTPHHFYSPDPFERNLEQFRVIPNEGELFYGIVQDGNDFWNATFFCGSCAVIRRKALDEVGGIAVETVTEDAHTSLRIQMKGWNTAYINIPQAAGLATERLSAHVGQRIRWARGMIQILRVDNPLFAPGLKLPQRLCYFNAMMHFMYAVPRLIFLSAPLIYLLLSHTNVPGYWAAILAYALPHLVLSNVANSRIQGEHRHSFWNEIYETVLSPYILLPTTMALINPKLGKFNVTAKGGVVKRTFFDARIAQPFLIMLIFNMLGLLAAIPRFFWLDRDRPGTVLMNVVWCAFNVMILGVVTAVAREMKQTRTTVRIATKAPVTVKLPNGETVAGETIDMSTGGTSISLKEVPGVVMQEPVDLIFALPGGDHSVRAAVVNSSGTILRVRFDELTLAEQEVITRVLYSRADSWLGWGEARESDNVLNSLGRIFQLSISGLKSTFKGLFSSGTKEEPQRQIPVTSSASMLLLALLLGSTLPLRGQVAPAAKPAKAAAPAPLGPGQFRDTFTLSDAGVQQIELHGMDNTHTMYFTLPLTHVPRTAKVHVAYAFSPALLPQLSQIKLLLNGTLFATIQPTPNGSGGSSGQPAETDFPVPPELLLHNNALTMQLIGHYTLNCEDPVNSAIWARVQPSSAFSIEGDVLPVADDLKQLPQPFLDPAVVQPLVLPVVFPTQPSNKAIQAAGIVTSYFGMISESRPVRFPVHVGDIPAGNAVVVAENPGDLPAGLGMGSLSSPTVAIRANPNDPYGKILIVSGGNLDQLIQAAQAVALHTNLLQGAQTNIDRLTLPDKQQADAAPRWAGPEHPIVLGDYASTGQLQGDGSIPLNVYFRVAPDMYYGDRPNAILHFGYRYNSMPIGPISSMQVRVNNAFLGSVPLPPAQETSRTAQVNLPVPVVNLRPFSNSLSFDFTFQLARKSACADTTPLNLQGSILNDSYLNLSGYSHYAALPNLETFANAGFPFTRFADLSGTTVVLPPTPSTAEIELFLTLMGHFSRQTGYPALRVTVAGPDSLASGAKADFLVLGIGDDQPAFDKLAGRLPVTLQGAKIQVHDTAGYFAALHHAWWKLRSDEHAESGDLVATGAPDGVIEGIENPYDTGDGKSLVAIRLKDPATFEPFMSTFLYVQQASDIQGSVSLLLGTRFQSFRIGSQVYHVGLLPWWKRLTIWLTEFSWMVAIVIFALAGLLAIWTRQWLRYRARARLRAVEN